MRKGGVAFGEITFGGEDKGRKWRKARLPERKEEERNVSHYGTERSDMANATFLLVATM